MHCRLSALALSVAALACATPQDPLPTVPAPAPKVPWSYAGPNGPARWGDLSPAYVLAKTGRQQSPIDIAPATAVHGDEPPLVVKYHDTTLEVLNNGHTVEDDYHDGGTLTVDGHVYKLAQFHFHSPSEHAIDGKHAPMEMHIVHRDADGKLAVVGVMIQEGAANAELDVLWKYMPTMPGRSKHAEGVQVNAAKLLPNSLASYRYPGSLTTPPCSEQVSWFVLREPITAAPEQIDTFRKVIYGNNRPLQPLNGRTITLAP